jgi:hypothetical protein
MRRLSQTLEDKMRHFILAAALLIPVSAAAQPTTEHEKLAGELARLLGTEEMFAAYLTQCTAPTSGYDPRHLFRENPAHFGGISPQSAYWPEIEALFQKYQGRMCAYISAAEFSRFFAEYYGRDLTTAELKAAVDFYSTPGGRKVSLANQTANRAFQAFAQAKMQDLYKSTYSEVSAEVVEVIRRYRRNPK